jgi:septin 3/9/12
LTRTHLQDLIETTAQIHYEAFRAKQLLAIKESTQPASSQASLGTTFSNSPNAMVNPNNLVNNSLTSPGAASSTVGSPAQSNK